MPSVIVLENEISLREDLVEYLESNNYQVSVAGSIRQFDALLQTLRPDMVLLKRQLPDGDGYEVLRHLRCQGSRCGVVVLADSPSIDDRIEAYELGADHYLAMPIRMRELLAVLSSLAWRTYASASWRVCPSTWHLFLPSSEPGKPPGEGAKPQEDCGVFGEKLFAVRLPQPRRLGAAFAQKSGPTHGQPPAPENGARYGVFGVIRRRAGRFLRPGCGVRATKTKPF
jgi:CheY-like chemotaxis protein